MGTFEREAGPPPAVLRALETQGEGVYPKGVKAESQPAAGGGEREGPSRERPACQAPASPAPAPLPTGPEAPEPAWEGAAPGQGRQACPLLRVPALSRAFFPPEPEADRDTRERQRQESQGVVRIQRDRDRALQRGTEVQTETDT